MKHYRISHDAQQDIDSILLASARQFGDTASKRYETLIRQALRDIAEDPTRAGVISLKESVLTSNVGIFHLRHSRIRAAAVSDRVKNPVHFVVFREFDADTLEIVRVLHDRMDVDQVFRDPSR